MTTQQSTGPVRKLRTPLQQDRFVEILHHHSLQGQVRFYRECTSTNEQARLLAPAALQSAGDWLVVAAESQTHGRGRLDRRWEMPPGAGLLFSLAMRLDHLPAAYWGLIPLVTGSSVVAALRQRDCPCAVKWPNDVVVPVEETATGSGGREDEGEWVTEAESGNTVGWGLKKLAGILVEKTDNTVVIGVGVNVSLTTEERPVQHATSLLMERVTDIDRTRLLADLVANIVTRLKVLGSELATDQLLDEYREHCHTLGAQVSVHQPSGETLHGTVTDIAPTGALVIDTVQGQREVLAGDVVHVRKM